MGIKTCSKCRQAKSTSEFHRRAPSPDGLQARCKPCHEEWRRENRKEHPEKARLYAKRWRTENPEKFLAQHRRNRARNYGLTETALATLTAEQGGLCAICGAIPAGVLHIDHCHTTGKVRGLLCNHCNLALGHLKDRADLMRAAAAYVEYCATLA